jgi:hypothetical protein
MGCIPVNRGGVFHLSISLPLTLNSVSFRKSLAKARVAWFDRRNSQQIISQNCDQDDP